MSLYVEGDVSYIATSKKDLGLKAMSVMFWVYVIESGSFGFRSLLSKMDKSLRVVTPTIKYSTQSKIIELIVTTLGTTASGSSSMSPESMVSTGALVPYRWTHLAFTISANSATIYINGN
jgi:hypothetical protein